MPEPYDNDNFELPDPLPSRSVSFWCDVSDEPNFINDTHRYDNWRRRTSMYRTRWRYVPMEAVVAEDYETYIFPELPSFPREPVEPLGGT